MDYASLLNKEQLAAVKTRSQYVRIIAGAGSGKTRVLTYRISYLISDEGVDPSRILAFAFTNKVANEMADRAGKLVPDSARFLNVSTFHSFCARFLRVEHKAIGYPIGFTIMDEDDQTALVKNVAVYFGYKKGAEIVKQALSYIRKKKCLGQYPEDIVINHPAFEEEKECLRFFAEYENRKRDMICLDFDDLLLLVIKVLENDVAIRQHWQNRFDHILIDEFQDTNDVQYKLLRLLIRSDTNVYVVGDPDQTIYTWRGANQNIILDFDRNFPGAETIILDRNYRSTKNILAAANRLIAHNKKRVPKNLYTELDDGDPITAMKLYSPEEEAKWVINKVQQLSTMNGPADYRQIALLYRSSYATRPFESEMASRGIPYRIFGGLRFYQRREVKDVLAYMRLLLNPADNISFERIINVPKRAIGDTSIEIIKAEALKAKKSDYEYMLSIDPNESSLSPRVIGSCSALLGKMEVVKKKLLDNYEVYSATIKDFITDIGYFAYIAEDEDIDEDRVANVNSLFDDITHYVANNPESTFEEYLQNVTLLTAQDDMNNGNYVTLMTIHVAKGLEFDNVFVIAMNDGSFPSMRAESESGHDGREEERRLAYVAMTRARKRLFLTCNTGYSHVTDSRSMPSCFFEDAGLSFPPSSFYGGYPGWQSKKSSYGRGSSQDFFGDGDAIDPFDNHSDDEEAAAPQMPETNGITDWKVGDLCHHEKFGDGVVISTIDQNIIVVNFKDSGKKTLLANHPLLSRLPSKGGSDA